MTDSPADTAAIRQEVGQANGDQQPYDAVVFLPGIGDKAGQTLADVARRFTTALDQRAATTDASFRYDDQSPAAVGIPGVSVCSIWRKDGPTERRIIDLYFLDYRLQLKQKYDDLSDVQRIVMLFFALVGSLRRYVARPLHLYKEVRPGEWRLLGLRLLGIGGFSVLFFHWIDETRPGFLGVLRTRLHFPIKESPIPSYGPWWWLLGLASVAALAFLIFAPRGKLPLRPWSRLTVAVMGLALIGTVLVVRYGPNLYDLLLGSETAPVSLGLNDVLYIVLLLLAAFTIIAATGLSFGAVDEPLPDREQFQFLLWLLAMSNLVLYLGVLILAFFHTARQSAQPVSSLPAPVTQGEAATMAPPGGPAPGNAGGPAAATASSPSGDATTAGQAATAQTTSRPPLPGWPFTTRIRITLPQQIVILVTAVLFLIRPSWKTAVTGMGNSYVYFYYYLGYGRIRPEVVGQFRMMIERISEQRIVAPENPGGGAGGAGVPLYTRVHVVAYSFGSVVAIDSLFPFNQEPPGRFGNIDGFVSIACPFDIIRTYFQEYPQPALSPAGANPNPPPTPYSYFENRFALASTPKRWFNVFSLTDVMSSNFRNDDQIGPANFGIVLNSQDLAQSNAAQRTGALKPENYHFVGPFNAGSSSFFDLLTLYGIRSHTGYWGQDTVVEDNCFEAIIPWLYQGHAILS